MAAPTRISYRLILPLLAVPVVWWVFAATGKLGGLNNLATDWLFQFRGEIPAVDTTKPGNPPLKVMYVDIDGPAVAAFGDRPWSRSKYAELLAALCQYGHPKAVGLDFILSPVGMNSDLVDPTKARAGDDEMQAVMQDFSQVVLAAEYSNTRQPFSHRLLDFPYIFEGSIYPGGNSYPEGPTYPIINQGYGRVGLLNIATTFNGDNPPDSVPRWVPLFAETIGSEHTLNLVYGMMAYHHLPDDSLQIGDDQVILLNAEKNGVLVMLPKIQHKVFYNLSVELALSYLGLDQHNVRRQRNALEIVDNRGKLLLNIPLTEHQLVEVNWFSSWNSVLNPRVSALDIVTQLPWLKGTPEQQAKAQKFFSQFQDAIVLIGPVDPILQDIAPTPFDSHPVPKVGVYGNLLKTFFSGQYIYRLPPWADPLLQFGLTALVGSLAMYTRRGAAWAKGGALLALAAYVGGVFEAFARLDLMLPLIVPVGSALSTAFLGAIIRLIDEEKQKRRIKGMFGAYLAPELVHELVESGQEPQLGGHQVSMTCFFSDVQGFSGFSEVLPPDKLFALMNEYLTAMTDILQAERGSLDKYIGDAIVGMYGAPVSLQDDALRACVAACRMQKRLGELREKWIGEGDKWPDRVHKMRARIGLNTGQAIVGNMGSTMRFNYSMMGDSVNLAARCESGAKQFGVYVMCTEDTKTAAEKNGRECVFRRLDKIIVKGRTTPVDVFEVVCLRAEATDDTARCIELFEKGLECYFAQKWDEAIAWFAQAQALEPLQPGRDPGVAHNPSELMRERCREMKADPPPPDWNGVFEMTEK